MTDGHATPAREPRPFRAIVLLNAAAALVVGGQVGNLKQGVHAAEAICATAAQPDFPRRLSQLLCPSAPLWHRTGIFGAAANEFVDGGLSDALLNRPPPSRFQAEVDVNDAPDLAEALG